MTQDRLPPHDIDAEEAVVGSLLLGERIDTLSLVPLDFYSERNSLVYEASLALAEREVSINQITLAQELAKDGRLETIGGAAYLSNIMANCPTSLDMPYYAEIVKRLSISRRLIQASGKIAGIGFSADPDVSGALDKADEALLDVRKHGVSSPIITPKDRAVMLMDRYEGLYQAEQGTATKTGLADLDYWLGGGVYNGDLIIIGSRPSVGKCLAEGSLICDSRTGKLIAIQNYKKDQTLYSLGGNGKLVSVTPSQIYNNGVKECFKVTTNTGRRVEVTSNHPFLTEKGWCPLDGLNIGDMIATPRSLIRFGRINWTRYKARLLAYLLAEGGLTRSVCFSNTDPVIINDFRLCVEQTFPECEPRLNSKCTYRVVRKKKSRKITPIKRWLVLLGLWGKLSKQKTIPNIVFSLSRYALAEFLRAFISCDGGYDRDGISITLASKDMVGQLQHLLLRFGILSQVHYKKTKYNGKHFDCWRLGITQYDAVMQYCRRIGFVGGKANYKVQVKQKGRTNIDLLPKRYWGIVKEECAKYGWSLSELERRRLGKRDMRGVNHHAATRRLTRAKLKQYAKILSSIRLKELASDDIFWDKIATIEPVGLKPTYDLTVADYHNFVANDIIVHNTSLMQFVANKVGHSCNVLFCSAEMSVEGISDRDVAGVIGERIGTIRLGGYSDELYSRIVGVALGEISERNVYYYEDMPLTSAKILQAGTAMKLRYGLGLVIVDYLGMLDDEYGRSGYDRISYISRKLKQIARKLDVPFIVAHQLNRALEMRNDKRPQLFDLRESGRLEEDADVVLFLYRENYYYNKEQWENEFPTGNNDYAEYPENLVEILIAKQRQGEANKIVKVYFDKAHQAYRDLQREEVGA